MPTFTLSRHVRGYHGNVHFNDPNRVYRQYQTMVHGHGFYPNGSYGPMVTYQLRSAWFNATTNEFWNDSAPSEYQGLSYFPANTSLQNIATYTIGVLQQTVTAGNPGGRMNIPLAGYEIIVAWTPDSPAQNNEGFTITQLYPRIT